MSQQLDLYYTMRSPYCYLATPTLFAWVAKYDLQVHLKPVYPLAVSDPTFFERVNPLWPPYVAKDTARTAKRLNIPFRWPRPDPIVQDMQTREVASEQPHIRRLTRLAQLAAEQSRGLDYVTAVSALLYNPKVDGWNTGDLLHTTLAHIGMDLADMDATATAQAERLDAQMLANREAQLASGHWGAPLMVVGDEIFFGQDRLDDLFWHLQHLGLQERG
jgi:2-hydroxychromene-2-carboxylate isomerase